MSYSVASTIDFYREKLAPFLSVDKNASPEQLIINTADRLLLSIRNTSVTIAITKFSEARDPGQALEMIQNEILPLLRCLALPHTIQTKLPIIDATKVQEGRHNRLLNRLLIMPLLAVIKMVSEGRTLMDIQSELGVAPGTFIKQGIKVLPARKGRWAQEGDSEDPKQKIWQAARENPAGIPEEILDKLGGVASRTVLYVVIEEGKRLGEVPSEIPHAPGRPATATAIGGTAGIGCGDR